ncbi:MAG: class II aldolase/adducin family protein [Eubacteriales bacterium]|nr:class II aldolase/adducin family protein [Eubacteriales bacterium]
MEYENERKEIICICRKLSSRGLILGTWGNVSMRVEKGILMTPSRISYDMMMPEDMVLMALDGEILQGNRIPTSEREVHRRIYLKRPDIGAIIHYHAANSMAVSVLEMEEIPCLTEEMSQLLGGAIPITSQYIPAQRHEALGKAAADGIGRANAVLLRNHGGVACGKDLREAFLSAEVVEKSCGIFEKASAMPYRYEPIPEEYVESEHYRYKYTYGKER